MAPLDTTAPPEAAAGEGAPAPATHYRRQLEAVTANGTLAPSIMDKRLTGFTLAELQGRPLHDCVHRTRPDGTPYRLAECPIDHAFPQNVREQGEEVLVHRDGQFYRVAFTASPIREGGGTVGTVIEARDITAERRERAERQRLLADLEAQRGRVESTGMELSVRIESAPGEGATFVFTWPASPLDTHDLGDGA